MINLENIAILVVEDDEMNFIYLKQIFKITKGNIERAKSGNEAVSKCRENNFDIVLMDIQLPDISGKEATEKIRQFNTTIPIVAQTASKTPTEIDEIMASGCDEVLVKPFKFDELMVVIEKFIK